MTTEPPFRGRLIDILSIISTPVVRENFSLNIDPNRILTNGFLSEFYTGTVQNKDTGEITHIAIKVVPANGILGSYTEVYKNEIHFYSEIYPELDNFQKAKRVNDLFANIPRYLGGSLRENKEFLIMQNLQSAGYELIDRHKYIKSEYLKMLFKVYAKFHALSFVYKHEHPEEFRNLTSELVDMMQYIEEESVGESMEAAYYAAVNTFSKEYESDSIERLKKVKNIRKLLANARNNYGNYTCLVHGDCWIRNMLFKRKESGELEDVKLIDFQLIYVSTPVYDLSYFFYSGAAKTDMDKVDYYLEIYYDSFSSFVRELGGDPQKIYPFAVLKDEWKKYSLIGMLIGIGMWVGKLMDKDEIISLISRKDLPKKDYFELWNAKMSEVRKASTFRQRARDICLHAIEYGVL